MVLKDSITVARETLGKAGSRIASAGGTGIAEALDRLFPMALPYYAKAHESSPVHHPAFVVLFMTEIVLGEGATETEQKCGLVAALLHDIAIDEKIRSAEIKNAEPGRRAELVGRAILSRLRHMTEGAEIAARILHAYNCWYGAFFSPGEIDEICRLISIHDNTSIAEYEKLAGYACGTRFLFPVGDRTMSWLREADRLWMVCREGIDVDLERDSRAGKTPSRAARLRDNIQRHRDECELYRHVVPEQFAEYGFREGTLYRSATGFSLFRRLTGEEGVVATDVEPRLKRRA